MYDITSCELHKQFLLFQNRFWLGRVFLRTSIYYQIHVFLILLNTSVTEEKQKLNAIMWITNSVPSMELVNCLDQWISQIV